MDGGAAPLLRMEGISKHYGGVRALEDVRFECHAGRIHAVLGENGAGKSTLIKIMSGVVQPDAGVIEFEGAPVTFPDPASANRAGVVCIFQELSLLPDLTVADNICITNPPKKGGLIDGRRQNEIAAEMLARVGVTDIHPMSLVADLPLSRRQVVEIAKALARNPKVLILDEATSALAGADVVKVFAMLKRLRSEGLAIVYISHRMHEIARACRRLHGLPQRAVRRDLCRRHQDRRSHRRDDDRPRIQECVSAAARGEARCPPCADRPEPFVDGAAQRREPRSGSGRGGRSRRSRRAGTAKSPAGAVRHAHRRDRHGRDRRQVGQAQQPQALQESRHRYGAHSGRPEERGPDARDVGPGQSLVRCHRRVQPLWHRRHQRRVGRHR